MKWLFPRPNTCVWCGRPASGRDFCSACRQQLKGWRGFYRPCLYCGRLLPKEGEKICGHCRQKPPPFTMARAVGPYQGLLKEMIWAFKYQGRLSLAAPLGRLLAQVVVAEMGSWYPELVVSVPLTPGRLKARSFNQAEFLGRSLAAELGLAFDGSIISRTKETAPQINLSREKRWQNMAGAFHIEVPEKIKGRSLLLVDDVLTTGATACACTGALMKSGSGGVAVVTLATGIEKSFYFST